MTQHETVKDVPQDQVENVNPSNFVPPPGYILVPEAVYNMLVRQAEGGLSGSTKPGVSKTIHLKILRAVQLGDIKTQLNPEEKIEWVPRRSITVRGKENHALGSFLCYWNRQDPRSFKYDHHFPPVFEVINPEVLEEILGPAPARKQVKRVVSEEEERIKKEEGRGDATSKNVTEPIQGLKVTHGPLANLPPSGSQERKDLIHGQSIERQNVVQRRMAGLDSEAPESVEDFKITTSRQDQRVVGMIDGPSAEAEAITEKEVAADERRRKQRR